MLYIQQGEDLSAVKLLRAYEDTDVGLSIKHLVNDNLPDGFHAQLVGVEVVPMTASVKNSSVEVFDTLRQENRRLVVRCQQLEMKLQAIYANNEHLRPPEPEPYD